MEVTCHEFPWGDQVYQYPGCSDGAASFEVPSVLELLSCRTSRDIVEHRDALFEVFGDSDAFMRSSDTIDESIVDPRWDSVGASRIDRHTMLLPLEGDSLVYLLRHSTPVRTLALYCHGHGASLGFASALDALPTHRRLYDAGFDVAAMAMPLLGDNADLRYDGRTLSDHNHFWELELDDDIEWSPIRLFVEPAMRLLNTISHRYDRIIMCGLSGGGWTTHIVSAMDTRIEASYPVAGSQPWYLRRPRNVDYEQGTRQLLDRANYLDMYVMACSDGRSQTQILNEYDACCFAEAIDYDTVISRIAREAGAGQWRALLDPSHDSHRVSALACRSIIRQELSGG